MKQDWNYVMGGAIDIDQCALEMFLEVANKSNDSDDEVIKDFAYIVKEGSCITQIYYAIKITRSHLIEKLDKLMILI